MTIPPASVVRSGEPALNDERDNDGEERGSFHKRGENQRRGLETTSHFRLARHSFHSLPTDAADTDARADDGESSADGSTELRDAGTAASGVRDFLDQGVERHCESSDDDRF